MSTNFGRTGLTNYTEKFDANNETNDIYQGQTRDQKFKETLRRFLGNRGIDVLAFQSFLVVFALLLFLFVNLSFNSTDRGASLPGLPELEVTPAIL